MGRCLRSKFTFGDVLGLHPAPCRIKPFNVLNQGFLAQKKDKYRRNGKGRRCYWGTEFIQLLLKNRMALSFSSNHPGANHPILQIVLVQNSQRGKKMNKLCSRNSSDDLCFFFCIYISSYGSSELLGFYLYMYEYTHINCSFSWLKKEIFYEIQLSISFLPDLLDF